jgi:hypothetical protein
MRIQGQGREVVVVPCQSIHSFIPILSFLCACFLPLLSWVSLVCSISFSLFPIGEGGSTQSVTFSPILETGAISGY